MIERFAPARILVTLAVGGCRPQSPGTTAPTPESLTLAVHTTAKLDLLFMIDNSPSMDAMQAELRAHFGDLLTRLSGAAAGHALDLHVGVVTSDYGAGSVSAISAGCEASPGGQRGHLQTIGEEADPSCQAPTGAPYIAYRVAADGSITSNLPSGQALVDTFVCMASVGSHGCGFEHQLESVYAALRDPDDANTGFLRDDAQLAVVFVTNEDDGSAPPASNIYDPSPSAVASDGAYDTFRQTRFGIACGDPLMLPVAPTGTPLTDCEPAPALSPSDIGREYDVERYIALFTAPAAQGGVKADPRDVILVGVMPPTAPFQVIDVAVGSGNGLGAYPNPAAYQPCPPGTPAGDSSCLVRLQHSCQNHVAPGFFGDPPLRLERVIDSAAVHAVSNICGDDLDATPSFAGLMQNMGGVMTTGLDGACLGGLLPDAAHPSCNVTVDGKAAVACAAGDGGPCWSVVNDDRCSPAERLSLRNVADGASVTASCVVVQ
jgi:hypothetical protein